MTLGWPSIGLDGSSLSRPVFVPCTSAGLAFGTDFLDDFLGIELDPQ